MQHKLEQLQHELLESFSSLDISQFGISAWTSKAWAATDMLIILYDITLDAIAWLTKEKQTMKTKTVLDTRLCIDNLSCSEF